MEWEKPPAPCNQISIVTDPVAGQKVLNLKWLPSQTDPFDATIVSTLAHDYSQYYAYGHAYYEAIFRATPKNIGGIWPGFWMAGVNAVIFHALPPYGYAPSSELDVVELRGEKPTFVSSNIHENGKGYGPGVCRLGERFRLYAISRIWLSVDTRRKCLHVPGRC